MPIPAAAIAGLAVSLLPQAATAIGAILAGPRGAEAAQHLAGAVAAVTGEQDPERARLALLDQPGLAGQAVAAIERALGEECVLLAEAENARRRDEAAAAARALEASLANSGSSLSWGLAAVTVVVLALFTFAVVGESFGLRLQERTGLLLDYAVIAVLGSFLGPTAVSRLRAGPAWRAPRSDLGP